MGEKDFLDEAIEFVDKLNVFLPGAFGLGTTAATLIAKAIRSGKLDPQTKERALASVATMRSIAVENSDLFQEWLASHPEEE